MITIKEPRLSQEEYTKLRLKLFELSIDEKKNKEEIEKIKNKLKQYGVEIS